MSEDLLGHESGTLVAGSPCRVVVAEDVVRVRSAEPDTAIVALVRSNDPLDAVRARLDGADVVLTIVGRDPSPEEIAAASRAAEALANRTRVLRQEALLTGHALGGTFSSVAMLAELLGGPARRREQLLELAAEGRVLGWRTGRASRSGGPMRLLDAERVVHGVCGLNPVSTLPSPPPVHVQVQSGRPAQVLVDEARFRAALAQLLDNAHRAGARSVTVEVATVSGQVLISVRDDGCGLPAGWTAAVPVEPFRSGWARPRDGLGLTEVAEFAEDSGGTLTVHRLVAGTEVLLTLPAGDRLIAPARPGVAGDPVRDEARILEAIARRAPLEETLDAIVLAMEDQLPGSSCSILLLDSENGSLTHGAAPHLPLRYRIAIDGVPIGPRQGSCGTAAFTRRPVVAEDIETDVHWPKFKDYALRDNLRSCWSTPIIDSDGGGVLGTFAVYYPHRWRPDADAADLVRRFTDVAAVAIGTSTLFSRLAESESRFRSAFEGAGVGMALVGLDGMLLQINPALGTLLGIPGPRGMLQEYLDPDGATSVARRIEDMGRAQGTRRTGPDEVLLHPADGGEPVSASMTCSVVADDRDQPRYLSVELFDLTERRRMAQAHRERDVAEAATKAKTEFLALASHELRTPLNAVIGFAQVMQLVDLTPRKREEAVEHILAAGRHLLRLINDLLDLSAAESGQLALEIGTVGVRAAVTEAFEIVTGLAADRGITLVGPGPEDETTVRADPQRLRQILINLLDNAVKYSAAGDQVRVTHGPGSLPGSVRICVADDGPGIAPEQQARIFEPFERIGDRRSEGSGLGLALSAQLVTTMGGRLEVSSTLGAGSTFWCELPHGNAPSASAAAGLGPQSEAPSPAVALPAGTLLYVEDDRPSIELIAAALAPWPGTRLLTAGTWREGLAITHQAEPDVLLLDIGLPDGSGWNLVRALSRAGSPRPAIVVLSAETVTVPDDLAVDAVLGKPVQVRDVLATLAALLPRSPG